jgi:hypothetical protein
MFGTSKFVANISVQELFAGADQAPSLHRARKAALATR